MLVALPHHVEVEIRTEELRRLAAKARPGSDVKAVLHARGLRATPGRVEAVKKAVKKFKTSPPPAKKQKHKGLRGLPNLRGKSFLFTGKLAGLTRDEAKDLVVQCRGKAASSVTAALDYLVRGSLGSDRYGDENKEAKVKALKKQGAKTKIISEKKFLELVGALPWKTLARASAAKAKSSAKPLPAKTMRAMLDVLELWEAGDHVEPNDMRQIKLTAERFPFKGKAYSDRYREHSDGPGWGWDTKKRKNHKFSANVVGADLAKAAAYLKPHLAKIATNYADELTYAKDAVAQAIRKGWVASTAKATNVKKLR